MRNLAIAVPLPYLQGKIKISKLFLCRADLCVRLAKHPWGWATTAQRVLREGLLLPNYHIMRLVYKY
jgi:hypothetical protein